jgi:Uma2 family endonuclease
MSKSAAVLAPLPFDLVLDDGEPLESDWHTLQLPLLRELIGQAMKEEGRSEFFVGCNMFVYYSLEQAREVYEEVAEQPETKRAFRGPDVFWVSGVDPSRKREAWIAWKEDGKLPDVIVELLSPSTAHKDRTEKKDLYARVFGTAEYFLYDPETRELEGWRLAQRFYRPIQPDAKGRLWSERLGVFVGLWHGVVQRRKDDWVRLFRSDESLVPTEAEAERQQAEAERQRAEAERQRADAAEAENARLRALLKERGPG